MREGHYMRHLRRLKRTYAARGEALKSAWEQLGYRVHIGGLAAVVRLPDGVSDIDVTQSALDLGMAPSPLSSWFAPGTQPTSGLLLGVASVSEQQIPAACNKLHLLIKARR